MNYRALPDTTVNPISEIGFGFGSLTTGWWREVEEEDACRLLKRAFEEGINFFDAADSHGNGRSEELLAKAFATKRDKIVIATKVGYDFYSHSGPRRDDGELPRNFTEDYIREAVERSLQRLRTDRVDVLQLHDIRMSEVENAALWELLKDLRQEGKILSWGASLGPDIGWLCEGVGFAAGGKGQVLQHIYHLLEREPAESIMRDACPHLRHLVRVPHLSGLQAGVEKIKALRFLEQPGRTLEQAALQWLLRDARIASCLPNINDEAQVLELARVPDCPPLTDDELKRIAELSRINFGVRLTEPPRVQGTAERHPNASPVCFLDEEEILNG